jgi:EAL domain-containing protein (putative c-di-GMP-specific phosphodiesterase class I)/integral membrane sensor domain MASE1
MNTAARPASPTGSMPLWIAGLVVVASAELSRRLTFNDGSASLFWPVAGLGFAFLHLWHWKGLLPLAGGMAIWTLASFPFQPWAIPLVVLAGCVGPVVVWQATRQAFGQVARPFLQTRQTLAYLKAQLLYGGPAAATVGTATLLAIGTVSGADATALDWPALASLWAVYWIIEVCGALLIAPVAWDVLVDQQSLPWRQRLHVLARSMAENRLLLFVLPVIALALAAAFAFTDAANARAFSYLLLPMLLIVANQCGPRATHLHVMLSGLLVSALTAFAMQRLGSAGNGSFAELVLLALFLTVSAAVMLMLVAVYEERRNALRRLEAQAFTDPYTGLANEAGFQRAYAAQDGPDAPTAQAPLVIQIWLANWQAIEQLQSASDLIRVEMEAADLLTRRLPEARWSRTGPGRMLGLHVCGPDDPALLRQLAVALGDIVASKTPDTASHDPVHASDTLTPPIETSLRTLWRVSAVGCPPGQDKPPLEVILARLREADEASKSSPTPPILLLQPGDSLRLRQAAETIEQTRARILRGDVVLYAQPIVANRPQNNPHPPGLKCEILCRLKNHRGEIIPPSDFMPAAMQGGLMQLLDQVVIDKTLAWFASHPEALARLAYCAINLSGPTMGNPELATWIRAAFERHRVPANRFTFEVTESQAIAQPLQAARTLKDLRGLGCRVAIDDFGTGHATYDYLKRFEVDIIKIDGAFIRELDVQPLDRVIVRSMVEVATLLGMSTVAEFVDSPEIRHWTRELGIDDCQGYELGRPQPIDRLFA